MTAGRRGRGWLAKGHMRQRDLGCGPPALGADRGAFLGWGRTHGWWVVSLLGVSLTYRLC